MGRKKIWCEERECFCGKRFMPEFSNQKYCCKDHARAARKAQGSIIGRKMLQEDAAGVINRYGGK